MSRTGAGLYFSGGLDPNTAKVGGRAERERLT